jgi:Xaa-Pro aminopeptidase
VDAAARAVIQAAGHGAEFFHITGHGTGFRYHEPIPMLVPGGTDALEVGMIFSVEPGIYAERFGGIRVEDNVLVTADGAEVLGPAERRLRP